MASDRVIIVRIAGCGTQTDGQYVFTSRAGLSYLGGAEVAGVVCDLSQQFTSEIGMFAAMGSDPTTAISMLTTATTLRACNSRAQLPVRNSAREIVTIESYVQPFALMQFTVSDGTALSIGNEYRANATVFQVTNIAGNTIEALRVRGSAANPIQMTKVGDAVVGAVIYDARDASPQGGIDGLPITVSTAELSAANASDERIIFRGFVTRVSNDTSAGSSNRISIECGSLLGFAQGAQFRPPIAQATTIWSFRQQINIGGRFAYSMTALGCRAVFDPRTDGFAYDGFDPSSTAYSALQLREGSNGGILMRTVNYDGGIQNVAPASQDLIAASVPGLPIADGESGGWTFATTFKDAHFGNASLRGIGVAMFENAAMNQQWATGIETDSDCVTEIAFLADSPVNLIVDLLLGTVNGAFGSDGFRAAQQAAWLPFDGIVTGPQDLIDYPALLAILEGREDVFPRIDYVYWFTETVQTFYALPYDSGADKTIGEILKRIMEKLGACMLFDRGRISFVSWAGIGAMPTIVNDTALASPAARLTFDRSACLQSVNCDVILRMLAQDQATVVTGEAVEQPIPIVNVMLGPSQRGKQMKVGTFRQLAHGLQQATGLSSFAYANAAIVRYSSPAATLGVSLRNAVRDLNVGESVIVSTAYLPNAYGTMGIENASGIVIKAARSWATPTTDYSILLTGYLNAVSGIALIAPSARIDAVVGDKLDIAAHAFTRSTGLSPGAPVNDADAFLQVREISGVYPLPVQLLDPYGTLIATDTCVVDVANSRLVFASAPFGGAASANDFVCLDTAANYFPATMWDAFQTDVVGEVAGSTSNAREWSS
jgi:hypothetical protein